MVKSNTKMSRRRTWLLSALIDDHIIFNNMWNPGHHRASLKIRSCTEDSEDRERQRGRQVNNSGKDGLGDRGRQ